MNTRRTLSADDLSFPESPRWWDGRVWCSDLMERAVFRLSDRGEPEVVAELPDMPSGLGFLPDGTPLVVGMQSMCIYEIHRGTASVYADLGHHGARNGPGNLNDMVVDGSGRAYVDLRVRRRFHSAQHLIDGTAAGRGDDPPPNEGIILVRGRGDPGELVAEGLVGPNGVAVTADQDRLVVAESLSKRVTSFDVRTDGRLDGRRAEAELVEGPPDGICLDAEGGVWIGMPMAQVDGEVQGRFVRVLHGRIVETIPVGDAMAVACVLGGPRRRTLFMATSQTTLRELRLMWDDDGVAAARASSRGRIEAVEVDVPGAGWP